MIPAAHIRFAADGMLRSLATWLRLLGYDCLDDRAASGRHLLERAVVENRVFLTRQAHLADRLPRVLLDRACIHRVAAVNLPDQLRAVVDRFDLDPRRHVFTRCLLCNTPLQTCARSLAADRVPVQVASREHAFWSCPRCHRVYWQGSHVHNSVARLERWLSSR